MLGVRGMALSAALTFGAVAWWASRGTEPAPDGFAQLREMPASHADVSSANAWAATAVRDDPAVADFPDPQTPVQADAGFDAYVTDKYHLLLHEHGRSLRGSESLRGALLARERLMVAVNDARQSADPAEQAALAEREERLAAADRAIRRMLPAAELAAFEALKDSHIEQFQLEQYVQGISQVAPLRETERRAILMSKLASRQRFREVLQHSGLMRGDLTPQLRRAAFAAMSRALRESRDGFLQEARQHLVDEEQYTLLANYENGEYLAELEKLRQIAGGG